MNNGIRYSIIIPHKNSQNLLRRCLNSIPQREDVQVIVVDDNSDDYDAVKAAVENFSRVSLYKNEGYGAGGARNTGLTKAHGKWLLFADCDDYYVDGFLEELDKYIDSEYDVIYFNFYQYLEGMEEPVYEKVSDYIKKCAEGKLSVDYVKYKNNAPWCKMVRRNFINLFQIHFEEIPKANDKYFSYQLGYFCRNYKVIDCCLYNYIFYKKSQTRSNWTEEKIRTYISNRYKSNGFMQYVNHPEWKHGFFYFVFNLLQMRDLHLIYKVLICYLHHYGEMKEVEATYPRMIEAQKKNFQMRTSSRMKYLYSPNSYMKIYAAWRKDERARVLSSSGGLASVISEVWVQNGGVVYGAAFVPPLSFQHIRCTTLEELYKLRGSKYVQSSIKYVINEIEDDLKNDKNVLFIGTPCQVAGIKTRFSNECSQLYTIDVICHGTPTAEVFRDSLPSEIENLDYDSIEFRNNNNYQVVFKRKGQPVWTRPLAHDLYLKGFFKAVFHRESCYHCKYATIHRISDLTLGDFWRLDATSVKTDMEKGISLVLVNTEKGENLMDSVEPYTDKVLRSIEEAVSGNKQLLHPMALTWRHKMFVNLYPKLGFKAAAILSMPDIYVKNLFK